MKFIDPAESKSSREHFNLQLFSFLPFNSDQALLFFRSTFLDASGYSTGIFNGLHARNNSLESVK